MTTPKRIVGLGEEIVKTLEKEGMDCAPQERKGKMLV